MAEKPWETYAATKKAKPWEAYAPAKKPPKPTQLPAGRSAANRNPLVPGMGGKPEAQPTMGEGLSDLWKSAAIGVPQIATDLAGMPRALSDMAKGVVKAGVLRVAHPFDEAAREKSSKQLDRFDEAMKSLGGGIMVPGAPMFGSTPSSDEYQGIIEKATGEWYKPKYWPGRLGNNIMRNIGGAVLTGPGRGATNLAPKIMSGVGAGAASQGANELSEATQSPWAQIPATIIGSMLGHRAGTIPQRYRPANIAASQIDKAAREAGVTPENIGARMDAGTQGPGGVEGYSLADAMGPRGQALMAQSAEGADSAVQDATRRALESKTAGAPGRVQGVLETLAGGPQTAEAFSEGATALRQAKANMDFDNIRANASTVDPTPTISYLDNTINPQNARKPNSVDQDLQGIRDKLILETEKPTKGGGTMKVTSVTDDWQKAAAVRQDISDMIDKAWADSDKSRVRALSAVRDELDKNLDSASPGYSDVMSEQAKLHQIIKQVEIGKKMSGPGVRTEDVTRHFEGLTPEQKNAFRTGFFNKPIAAAQGIEGNIPSAIGGPRFGANAQVVGVGGADLPAQLATESGLAETGKKFERAVARSEVPGGAKPSDMSMMDYVKGSLPGGAMAASGYYALQNAGSNPLMFALLAGLPLTAAGLKKASKMAGEKAMPKILEQLNVTSAEDAARILRQAARRGYKAPASSVAASAGILGALAGDRANR